MKLQTWGGWGDVLREVALLPVRLLRPRVFHLPPTQAGVRPEALAPSADRVRDFLDRCPAVVWGGVGAVSRRELLTCRALQRLGGLFRHGLYDPGFQWRAEDLLPPDAAGARIVVQTHLEGLASKRWPIDSWRVVLSGLQAKFPGASIEVLDPAGAVFAQEGVRVHDRLTFPQAVRLVESCALLVSVDSWSKYVASWRLVPQIVLVPDQTPDYPQLTAQAVWTHSFRGVRSTPGLAVVGLSAKSGRARYTLGPMANFQPRDVLTAVVSVADRITGGAPKSRTP